MYVFHMLWISAPPRGSSKPSVAVDSRLSEAHHCLFLLEFGSLSRYSSSISVLVLHLSTPSHLDLSNTECATRPVVVCPAIEGHTPSTPMIPKTNASSDSSKPTPTQPNSTQSREWHGRCPYNRCATSPRGSILGVRAKTRATRVTASTARTSSLAYGFSFRSCHSRWV